MESLHRPAVCSPGRPRSSRCPVWRARVHTARPRARPRAEPAALFPSPAPRRRLPTFSATSAVAWLTPEILPVSLMVPPGNASSAAGPLRHSSAAPTAPPRLCAHVLYPGNRCMSSLVMWSYPPSPLLRIRLNTILPFQSIFIGLTSFQIFPARCASECFRAISIPGPYLFAPS